MDLNKYPADELEVLQLAIAIAHEKSSDKKDPDSTLLKWNDRINEALNDARFEEKQLPFNV